MIIALAGCVSATGKVSYPVSWAPIDAGLTVDGFPWLEGKYSNSGVEGFPAELGEPLGLSEVLTRMGRGSGLTSPRETGRVWDVPVDAVSVSISQTPGKLKVTFFGENGKQTGLDFRRYHFNWSEKRYDDLFSCYASAKGPRLRFFAEPENHSAGIPYPYLEGGGSLVFLLKAADGSLIVQWLGESVGISTVLVGSHIVFNSVWWRYPPLRDAR